MQIFIRNTGNMFLKLSYIPIPRRKNLSFLLTLVLSLLCSTLLCFADQSSVSFKVSRDGITMRNKTKHEFLDCVFESDVALADGDLGLSRKTIKSIRVGSEVVVTIQELLASLLDKSASSISRIADASLRCKKPHISEMIAFD